MLTLKKSHPSLWVVLIILLSACQAKTDRQVRYEKAADLNINKPFKLTNIVDSSGNKIELDFSKSDLTLVDFWNNACPPCINEMKQFADLLKGKESKISVYSISLNQFWLWKQTLSDHKGVFSFLDNNISNWKQFNLMTTDDPKLKNGFSFDRSHELELLYNVKLFPSYFVINKKGLIISSPENAVEFIKDLD